MCNSIEWADVKYVEKKPSWNVLIFTIQFIVNVVAIRKTDILK